MFYAQASPPLFNFLLCSTYVVGACFLLSCPFLRQSAKDNEKDESETRADTQDKQAHHGDESEPRKAFSAAPTFEEFLKFKQAEREETELKIP